MRIERKIKSESIFCYRNKSFQRGVWRIGASFQRIVGDRGEGNEIGQGFRKDDIVFMAKNDVVFVSLTWRRLVGGGIKFLYTR